MSINSNQTMEEGRALSNLAEVAGGVNWAFDNDNGLQWGIPDAVTPAPTQAEVDAEIARFTAEDAANEYKNLRQREYPSIKECVHAILDDDLAALQVKRQAVKDKYPKE